MENSKEEKAHKEHPKKVRPFSGSKSKSNVTDLDWFLFLGVFSNIYLCW